MDKHLYLQQFLAGPSVALPELLDQKEQRAQRQRELLSQGGCLICFTLNIAGPVKNAPPLPRAFAEGRTRILQQLQWHEIDVTAQEYINAPAGEELYLLVDGTPESVKSLMVEIEDSFPMGRLFDIDVLSGAGQKVSREELGLPPRTCLLCGERAVLCARGRTHTTAQLQERTVQLICDYFNQHCADVIAQLCCRALLYEVSVTPKPGLVDRANSGAHRDMDLIMFLDSACALTPYFRDCALRGLEGIHLPPRELFRSLRYPGRRAEEDMRRTAKGSNPHKGAIFSMGILSAALGRLCGLEESWSPADVFALCREMCAGLLENDLVNLDHKKHLTHGEALYQHFGAGGARGEAAAGFPSVAELGLPSLKRYIAEGRSLNDAGAFTLLHLMAQVTDTNMIHRSSWEETMALQERLRALLQQGPSMEDLHALDQELTQRNISPGGCADLLALSFLLWLAERELPQEPWMPDPDPQ